MNVRYFVNVRVWFYFFFWVMINKSSWDVSLCLSLSSPSIVSFHTLFTPSSISCFWLRFFTKFTDRFSFVTTLANVELYHHNLLSTSTHFSFLRLILIASYPFFLSLELWANFLLIFLLRFSQSAQAALWLLNPLLFLW